jgi:ATP-binding cassette, subfamily A (ABC1), member 2
LNRYGGLSFDHESSDQSNLNFIRRNLAKVWYNHKAFHAIPTYINVMNNAILRANVKKSYSNENLKAEGYSITVINHPMNRTNNYLSTEYILQGSDVIISIFTIVAMSFVPASFVLFLVYERSIKSLHLQFLIGLNPLLYWITNFIWDLFNYLLPASCVIIILRLFNVSAYVEQNNFSAVIALFLLYGWSISPLMYPFSYLFNEPSNAYICLIVLNLFTGITCVVSSFLLQIFSIDSSNGLNFVYEFFKQVFLVFPPYCLGRGLIDIAYNDYYNVFYTKTGQLDKVRSPFEWDITARNLVSMACIGILSWIFTLLLEYNCLKPQLWLEKIKNLISSKTEEGFEQLIDSETSANVHDDDDIDVKIERLRVEKSLRQNDLYDHLIVHGLNKVYPQQDNLKCKSFFSQKNSKGFTAVHNLTVGVPKGECFG